MPQHRVHTITKPLEQQIFTRKSHSIVYADLLSKGTKTVLDIYNPVGLLESWQSISQKFGLENANYMRWYSAV